MGISYVDTTGIDGITLTADTNEGGGAFNLDDFTYTIDVDALAAAGYEPDEIITITGDWHRGDDRDLDGYGTAQGGEYYSNVLAGPAMPGSYTLDSVTGAFSWTVTVQDLIDYAIDESQINMRFSGDWGQGSSDADKMKIVITCFVDGTMIATPSGEATIEALKTGDMVLTADGRSVPVKWVGRKTIQNHVMLPAKALPVCISAGALGNGLPHRDLYLSADHGMIVDEMVVNAGVLVNGTTIRFVDLASMPKSFTYWHIETEQHDEIIANGAPAETFVDYIGRQAFDNYQEYLDLYGCERMIPEMKRTRISAQRQLPDALQARFGILSFDQKVEGDVAKMLTQLAA